MRLKDGAGTTIPFDNRQARTATLVDARVLLGSPAERTYYAWRQGNAVDSR